ncbi:phage tail sheath C-terminal domain-containing protein [Streptomyces sp. FIT100]|uniref:phage tail sheath C-terminal domain-containing protein n=1 Tax=Streptomyces sp. FIT100 TaxID=2837956 RepID=UPI0021C6C129|nr:phage tail sheath C-terminal domain-containing protein [Streptomyces sp. FIT100]UUN30785.1 phage tail sheath subtilisin-like domain-containing protein [Streptomyces sp. FIT100]
MTTPLAPGVYVKEVPSGVRSIIGAGTSTPAFLGNTATIKTIKTPTLVRSWTEFRSKFFPTPADAMGALAKASEAYQAAAKKQAEVDAFIKDVGDGKKSDPKSLSDCNTMAKKALEVAEKAGSLAHSLGFSPDTSLTEASALVKQASDVGTTEAKITKFKEDIVAFYGKLDTSSAKFSVGGEAVKTAAGNVKSVVDTLEKDASPAKAELQKNSLTTADTAMTSAKVDSVVLARFGLVPLADVIDIVIGAFKGYDTKWCLGEAVLGFFANGGSSCYIVPVTISPGKSDLAGTAADNTGLAGLEKVQDVSMVAVPDLHLATADTTATAATALKPLADQVVSHCAKMRNRLAIIHTVPGLNAQEAGTFRDGLGVGSRADLATLYYPWLEVPGIDGKVRTVPPSGHIAGVWAATDTSRGVFKAPANVSLSGAISLATPLSDDEQAGLNAKGVNCLRSFPGRPLMVWGARTLADPSDRDWKYVNVRRLVCFLSDSIKQSTSWAVFEPNDDHLWATLRHSVSSFLKDQWRQGALQGATPEEAFHVVCDASNNPQDLIDKGEVHCDIYVAPVRPAEFVHFSIQQTAGQAA